MSCFDITKSEPTNLSLASTGAVVTGSMTELAESLLSPMWLSPEGSDPGEDSEISWLFMSSGLASLHTEELSESSVTALHGKKGERY